VRCSSIAAWKASKSTDRLDRVAERVVEEERPFTGDVALRQHLVEQVLSSLERGAEPLFLAPDHLGDQLLVLDQIGVRAAHHRDRRVDQHRGHQIARAQAVGVAHRAADDAAQHVAALLVARHDSVRDQEGHGAGVFGQDAQRHVRVPTGEALVRDSRRLLGRRDERPQQVDVPDGLGPLQHREVALEPRAGVDAPVRQWDERAVRLGVELHEHEVPDLDVPVVAPVLRAALGPELGPEVPEDLRARATGTGVPHAPEIVVAEALDPLRGDADRVTPDGFGLVVGLVDGHPQPLRIETQHLGVELPGERDGLGLEVIAEREVAQHLEEREVAVRAADVVQVVVLSPRADTFLARGRAGVRRRLLAGEVRLERDHPGDGEEHRLVVRDQARARDQGVAARNEEVEEGGAQLVRGHLGASRRRHGDCQATEPGL
jgi:hypothetical protein